MNTIKRVLKKSFNNKQRKQVGKKQKKARKKIKFAQKMLK